uniref:hypothetical protein n=1 Tax=Psychromonas sp. Urea-02u-13 TaxID=2058326 RepID=UPI000CB1ACA9
MSIELEERERRDHPLKSPNPSYDWMPTGVVKNAFVDPDLRTKYDMNYPLTTHVNDGEDDTEISSLRLV